MTTVVVQIEMPDATDAEVAAEADTLRHALAAHPDIETVEVEAEGPTRTLDPVTVVQTVLAAVTTIKTLVETVRLLADYFRGPTAGKETAEPRIDPARVLVEIDGRFVRITELTDTDLQALAKAG